MAHLDRHEQHFIKRKEHRDLDEDRQTPSHGVHLLLLVKLHQSLLLPRLVVLEALLKLLHLRLQLLHLAHGLVGLVGKGEKEKLHENGRKQDRNTEIADEVIEEVHQVEHRLGDEKEPSPIDELVETVDAIFRLAILKEFYFLGSGEQFVCNGFLLARRDSDRFFKKVGIKLLFLIAKHPGVIGLRLIGDENGRPILVGKTEPAAFVGNRFLDRIRGGHVILYSR